ncbi:hypothetical protein [Streptomyces sp. NPDC056632]|uniref:hypothetical protein n=1 Tax=Streptomyces sp. NPDC056632 TaxID=3345884 RepID=UPI00367B2D71
MIMVDAGYDAPSLARLLADPPVERAARTAGHRPTSSSGTVGGRQMSVTAWGA